MTAQTRRLVLLFVALVVLAAGAWWALRRQSQTSTLPVQSSAFAYADTGAIDRVFVATKAGAVADMRRSRDGRWRLADGTLLAPFKVAGMLATVANVRVKRPVTDQERQVALADLATGHYKVELYRGTERVLSYFLGPETDAHQGNYALLEGADDPYVVYMPNFQGYPSASFEIDGLDWRDKRLFGSTPRSLQAVQVRYRDAPGDNLDIRYRDKYFMLMTPSGVPDPAADTVRLMQYLGAYGQAYVEQYHHEPRMRDSLLQLKPAVQVTVRDLDPTLSHELWLYPHEGYVLDKDSKETIMALLDSSRQLITIQPQNYAPLLERRPALLRSATRYGP